MKQMGKIKKLGVIGGMGPKASSLYYDRIIRHTKADSDQDHIDMIILSHASMPDRSEAIISGCSAELVKLLCADAVSLEQLGVSNIAITCNTSHYFYEQIQNAVNIPVINMITESISYAVSNFKDVERIGIMATDGTINSHIYNAACIKAGVRPVILSHERQKDVMSLIYADIKSGYDGDENKFKRALDEFKDKECEVVILACTELSVYKQYHDIPEFCLDAMDILVKESILRSGAEYQ